MKPIPFYQSVVAVAAVWSFGTTRILMQCCPMTSLISAQQHCPKLLVGLVALCLVLQDLEMRCEADRSTSTNEEVNQSLLPPSYRHYMFLANLSDYEDNCTIFIT